MKMNLRSGMENNNRAGETELGDNPCFECICVPVCKQKMWPNAIIECELLMKYTDVPHSEWKNIIKAMKSKKFFEMKNWE